ncbi:MAG: glycosyltransferase family 4 protein [Candidatus Omnitrophica bacterium]|nr:glycosyltransferase family 4 protein [Candidatus Omnitrophota bacterium]
MKILIIPSVYKPNIGGVEEFTAKLSKFCNEKDHNVFIATNKWPSNLSAHELIDDVEVNRFNFFLPSKKITDILKFLFSFPISFIKFLTYLKRKKLDIVNIQCVSSNGFYTLLAKKILRFPLVVTLQGETVMDDYDIYNKSALMRWTLKRLMKKADWIIANSSYILEDALSRFGGDRSKCSIVYNGVDLEEFKGVEPYRYHKTYIFATGRLVYKKGFDLLVKAFSKITDKYEDVDLLISGRGDFEPELIKLITAFKLTNRVFLLGPADRNKNVSLFKGCEFFVMPSRLEPFGIVCLEAMAAGKPVIYTKNGGTKEFVNDDFGIQVDPENIDELSKALISLLSDDEKCKDMGKKAREEVNKFNWPIISQQYIELYKKVLKENA